MAKNNSTTAEKKPVYAKSELVALADRLKRVLQSGEFSDDPSNDWVVKLDEDDYDQLLAIQGELEELAEAEPTKPVG